MFEQVKLTYDFNALEPHIDTVTMETHYGKHHAAYTGKLNEAMESLPNLAGKSITEILTNLDAISDPALQTTVRNNGGGFYNHNLYFSTLSPQGGKLQGALAAQIDKEFGDFATLKEQLTKAAITQFGSGWAWLSTDKQGNLQVSSTPNQDNPLMVAGGKLTPIFGIDVWEHAYYLKYKNLRPDYVKAIFEIIDWAEVGRLYDLAKS